MNTKLTIENIGPGAVLCTLALPIGDKDGLQITMELPKDSDRTATQLEYLLLQRAKDRLAEMCSQHPANKRA